MRLTSYSGLGKALEEKKALPQMVSYPKGLRIQYHGSHCITPETLRGREYILTGWFKDPFSWDQTKNTARKTNSLRIRSEVE